MRFLAVDFGRRRTGLAVCDPDETLAGPVGVLTGAQNRPEEVAACARRYAAEAVVVGLPLNMDGTEGTQAQWTRQQAERLAALVDLPIFFQDERLSSFAAQTKRPDLRRGRRRKGRPLDALAAAEILEAFLERRRAERDNPLTEA